MLIATLSSVGAKNTNHSPDFSANEYWNNNAVYTVRVTNVSTNRSGSSDVAYEIVTVISGIAKAKTRTVPLALLWFWQTDSDPAPALKSGDYLLWIEPIANNDEPIVVKKITAPSNDPLIKSLTKIAELRKTNDPQALLENTDSPDELVSEYCLKRLMEVPNPKATATHIKRLKAQRDTPGRPANLRILSHRLASKLSEPRDMDKQESAWLQEAILKNDATDYQQIRPFVDRLVELVDERKETAVFLTKVVKNPKASLPARIAAYGSFQDPRLFNFGNPDDTSELIYATCLEMLKDKQPEIRSAGAALLPGIVLRISEDKRKPFADRARKAMTVALKAEKNDTQAFHLKTYLEQLGKN